MKEQIWASIAKVNLVLKHSYNNLRHDKREELLAFYNPQETIDYNTDKANEYNWLLVDSIEKLKNVISKLKNCKNYDDPVAWDTETTSLNVFDCQLIGIGICWYAGLVNEGFNDYVGAYIPLNINQEWVEIVKHHITPIIINPIYPKVLHHAKYDRQVFLKCWNIKLDGVINDTMINHYIAQPHKSHGLKSLAISKLKHYSKSYVEVVGDKDILTIPFSELGKYCLDDTWNTKALDNILRRDNSYISDRQQFLLDEVEIPLESILSDMEMQGLDIDNVWVEKESIKTTKKLLHIEKRIAQLTGKKINLKSVSQLRELLFVDLKLPTMYVKRTPKGELSTDEGTLTLFKNDSNVVRLLLAHRGLSKVNNTYLNGAFKRLVDGKLHSNFNQTVTLTGRLSSSNPNLQNIPKKLRRAIIAPPGYIIIAADYSQCELKFLAHFSKEPTLLKAFRNDEDVHVTVARILFNKEHITKEERRYAKTLNFGVLYGMQEKRLSNMLSISLVEAKSLLKIYWTRLPFVKDWLIKVYMDVFIKGYVETIMGRRRYLELGYNKIEINNPDAVTIQHINDAIEKLPPSDQKILREAGNAPIQGSNADLTKMAMVDLYPKLKPYDTSMLIQIHDELVFKCPIEYKDVVIPIIRHSMENVLILDVPITVDINIGTDFYNLRRID